MTGLIIEQAQRECAGAVSDLSIREGSCAEAVVDKPMFRTAFKERYGGNMKKIDTTKMQAAE